MSASITLGAVGKFMPATHIGMGSKPASGLFGAICPVPKASTAIASFPARSMMEVKSYLIVLPF
jgi:hypothetical protein